MPRQFPRSRLYGAAVLVILLTLWEVSARLGWVNAFILPAPSAVLKAGLDLARTGELGGDILRSVWRVCAGFALSVLIGTPLGLSLALSPRWRWSVDPLLQFIRPIPPIAWIPLTILWFGLGDGPAYCLTLIASFFPIVLGAYFGASRVDPQHLDVARVFGAGRWRLWREVIWPSALPSILNGYRVGFGIAWMAVVAAEMVAAQSGLGYLIEVSQNLVRTDRVLVGMLAIGALGFLFDRVFLWGSKRWLRWSS